jgi:hypothetical protein
MPKFRKKPVVVEAVQWDGNNLESLCKIGFFVDKNFVFSDNRIVIFYYLRGVRGIKLIDDTGIKEEIYTEIIYIGDWVIKNKHNIYYIATDEWFKKTYEAVDSLDIYGEDRPGGLK